MTSPGRYSASDGSFAKSAGNAAARGGILIGIAVLIGVLLLWKGFDGGSSAADLGPTNGDTDTTVPIDDDTDTTEPIDDGTDTTEPIDDGTDTTAPIDDGSITPAVVDPPADVTVMVLNATGTAGLAGGRSSALGAKGYVVTAGNAAANVVDSKVYYTETFADEAKAVVEALSGPGSVLAPAPADLAALAGEGFTTETADADVIVVLGSDEALE